MVLCIMQNVPDNILNVRELSGVVREHLGSTSWTQPILNPALFDGIQSCTTHGVQKHKCVPTYTMALEGIWSARMFPLRITGLAFLCQVLLFCVRSCSFVSVDFSDKVHGADS